MAPSWWSGSGSVKGYTAAQKASLKAADSMLRESRSRSFEDEYEPLSSLGSGGAATVARCVHRASGAVVAAKRIPLAGSGSSSSVPGSSARQAALIELASLILLQGAPHAIELLDAIEEKGEKGGAKAGGDGPSSSSSSSQNCVFLVTRLCAGGELFDAIVSKEHYCEREAALVVKSLAGYLAAAHRFGVVHRDLKPENVMLLASGSSSKNSSPTKAAAAAAAAWPAPPPATLTAAAAPVPPAATLQRLPSRLCREASDVAAMLSACPPPMRRRSSFSGERTAAAARQQRRRTTGTGAKEAGVFFEEEEEDVPFAAAAAAAAAAVEPESALSSIEGRRRCSCLEREGIRVIDLGCAALFDPASAAAAAADAPPISTSTTSSGQGGSLKKMVGTPYYAAPEVLPGSPFPLRGAASDVWSLGVIAFVLLSGRPPFGGRDDAEVARRVAAGRFSFRGEAWARVSDAAKSAISSMLEKDPSRRATAAQVLESEWLLLSSEKTAKKEEVEEEEEEEESAVAAAAVAAAAAAVSSSSSASNASSTRLRARIRAFAAESKLHAVAAVALTRTVSGAEGAAQLREMILLQEGLSESESSSEEEEEEDKSGDGGDGDGKSVVAPRLGGGGAAVVPSRSSRRREAPPFSHRCSAPGGLEGEQKRNNSNNRSAPGTPKAAAGGGRGGLGGLLRRTLTLGASSANAAAALAAAAAALPLGCRECEACGGLVVAVEGEEREGGEEEGGGGATAAAAAAGAEAFLEGLLLGGRHDPEAEAAAFRCPIPSSSSPSSGAAAPPPPPPPPPLLLRTQTTVGAERAAELAFAALDADGDGWLCVEDLLRAGREEEEGEEKGKGKGGAEGDEAERKKKEKKKKHVGEGDGGALMTREEALACIAEARKVDVSHGIEGEEEQQGDRMDFEGFKRVLWRKPQAHAAAGQLARN